MIDDNRRIVLAQASAANNEAATRALMADRSGGQCEASATRGCTGQATDWHHRKRRREGDDSIRNSLHLCRTCHSWVHANPATSKGHGWIVPSWDDPAVVPVTRRGVPVLLLADGGYTAGVKEVS